MSTPEGLFADLVARRPAQPFVTFYDDRTGERTELSAKSLGNWVAKTHFLLSDELGLGVGDTALILAPAHWITVPALLGVFSAGLAVSADAGGAAVAFATPETLDAAGGVPDVYALAPASAAVGFRGSPPDGAEDYVTAVRPQPDAWASVKRPAGEADPGAGAVTRGGLVASARARIAELGLSDGARVLSARPWLQPDDWTASLLVALALGGSLVLVANGDEASIARHADQERAVVIP